jgi:RNA polymerase sigma-70 factor (family 1)
LDGYYIYDERQIILRVSKGDESAFTELFNHHRDKIYSTAIRLTASREMAEEILQDVFLKIWMKRNDLPGIENFEAYLHTIARRATYRGLKQLATEKQRLTTYPPETHLTGEHMLQLKEYQTILTEAINRLPDKQRETYRLIREQGYTRNEVAGHLGVSAETVKYNLDEGLRKIRVYFMAHTDYLPVLALFIKFLQK